MRRYGIIDDETFWRERALPRRQISPEELDEIESTSERAFDNLTITELEAQLHAAAFGDEVPPQVIKRSEPVRPNTYLGKIIFTTKLEQAVRPQ